MKLPPKTIAALIALEATEGMRASNADFWKIAGVATRSHYAFRSRLMDQGFIDWTQYAEGVALTFKGMQAIKAHFEALYASRPCEAYRIEIEKRQHLPSQA